MNKPTWMVGANIGGWIADEFRDKRFVAIGWGEAGERGEFSAKASLLAIIERVWAEWKRETRLNAAGQFLRFRLPA